MKSLKSFSVFNRWGKLVFYSTTMAKAGMENIKELDQDAGVYVWILEFYDKFE